jgi:regulator of replication initiation timing
MREVEFDQINAGLDGAEFAIEELKKKVDELHRKAASVKTLEEMVALKLEVGKLSQRLRKISDAVHAGNPAPHFRLVSDIECNACGKTATTAAKANVEIREHPSRKASCSLHD